MIHSYISSHTAVLMYVYREEEESLAEREQTYVFNGKEIYLLLGYDEVIKINEMLDPIFI